jgi:hypothetical protein
LANYAFDGDRRNVAPILMGDLDSEEIGLGESLSVK